MNHNDRNNRKSHFVAGREVFLHYNYGKKGNLQRYGQVEPLTYDLSRVTSPVYIYYSDNDPISTAKVFPPSFSELLLWFSRDILDILLEFVDAIRILRRLHWNEISFPPRFSWDSPRILGYWFEILLGFVIKCSGDFLYFFHRWLPSFSFQFFVAFLWFEFSDPLLFFIHLFMVFFLRFWFDSDSSCLFHWFFPRYSTTFRDL